MCQVVCICMRVYVYTYIHTHIYTYIYIYICYVISKQYNSKHVPITFFLILDQCCPNCTFPLMMTTL